MRHRTSLGTGICRRKDLKFVMKKTISKATNFDSSVPHLLTCHSCQDRGGHSPRPQNAKTVMDFQLEKLEIWGVRETRGDTDRRVPFDAKEFWVRNLTEVLRWPITSELSGLTGREWGIAVHRHTDLRFDLESAISETVGVVLYLGLL